MDHLAVYNSTFSQNYASQNGFAIYILNSITVITIQNNIFSNNFYANATQIDGSVIVLENAGNVSIIDSHFEDNFGTFGTCLTYSETSKKYICYFFCLISLI